MKRTSGFSIVEGLVVVGVLVLVVGVGYFGLKALTKSTTGSSNTTSLESSPKGAEVITSKADLEAAEKELDSLSFDDQNDSEAESQASL